jgi:hypothetical protein
MVVEWVSDNNNEFEYTMFRPVPPGGTFYSADLDEEISCILFI